MKASLAGKPYAFLHEVLLSQQRIEYSIRVYSEDVVEILLYRTCCRIICPVWRSHGIKECVAAISGKGHERIPYGISSASCKDSVLKNMEYSCIILRWSVDSVGKEALLIISGEEEDFHICLFMSEEIPCTSIVRAFCLVQKDKG